MTRWRAARAVMQATGLDGPQASPKGLRPGFGRACRHRRQTLNLVQKWLGHAQLSATAIYADAVGAEEKDIARRIVAICAPHPRVVVNAGSHLPVEHFPNAMVLA